MKALGGKKEQVVVTQNYATITPGDRQFSYDDACKTAEQAIMTNRPRIACICLEGVTSTTTSALARLILLRKDLLHRGRDLQLVGLRGRAKVLYEICRLDGILPHAGTGLEGEDYSHA